MGRLITDICFATVEYRISKLQGRLNTELVTRQELFSGATKGFEPEDDPQFLGCSLGDVIYVVRPGQVTGECDTK